MKNYRQESALKPFLNNLLEWAEVIILSVFIVIFIFTFVFRVVIVEGNSMMKTLYDDDMLLVSNIMYEPDCGDIVVLESDKLGKTIVKRVIAEEGQTVVIDYKENTVSVDGNILNEYSYLDGLVMLNNPKEFDQSYCGDNKDVYTYNVPENCIFVLGDNRNHSSDSRTIGCVNIESVVGKVFFRATSSYGEIGIID